MKFLNVFLIALLACTTLVACDVNEGPMEEAGENVDDAVDDAEGNVDETFD